MPCDQVRTVTVEFGPNTDVALMAEGLKSLGYSVTLNPISKSVSFSQGYISGRFQNNRLDLMGRYGAPLTDEATINPIKNAYSREVVKATAKRNRWQIEEISENEFIVTKGSF